MEESSIVKLVHNLLQEAMSQQVSDIHFEPQLQHLRIRFRQYGILQECATHPLSVGTRLLSRLKIIADLDVAERRFPQDGRIRKEFLPHPTLDVRVSTCPTLHGEKMVLRLLNLDATKMTLPEIGLSPLQLKTFEKAIRQPQGLILITGPTGSGKTSTLYAALEALNSPHINISTVEDPIEMHMSGINQVAIHSKIGLDFSTILRAFLRQDPDVIMVGEIRDKKTAHIAITAAETGHLVFSTLHTNHAMASITRLMHLGISDFRLQDCLRLVVAQRLVRTLCMHCKKLQQQEPFPLYQALGCKECSLGYKGRTGIFEILSFSPGQKIQECTQKDRQSLHQAALEKIQSGITTQEEIQRVLAYE